MTNDLTTNDLLVVGLNHKTAPLHVREQLALAPSAKAALTQSLKKYFERGSVILSTCNRVEFYTLAQKGNPNIHELPKPIFNKGGCNLSFAGLKTAVLKVSKNIKNEQDKFDIAASFQKTILDIMYKKTKNAFTEYETNTNTKNKFFVVAGGVAANKKIRSMLIDLCNENNYENVFPPINLCGDNGAMIALVGLEKFKMKRFDDLDFPAKPRWQLDESATFLKGAGVKL